MTLTYHTKCKTLVTSHNWINVSISQTFFSFGPYILQPQVTRPTHYANTFHMEKLLNLISYGTNFGLFFAHCHDFEPTIKLSDIYEIQWRFWFLCWQKHHECKPLIGHCATHTNATRPFLNAAIYCNYCWDKSFNDTMFSKWLKNHLSFSCVTYKLYSFGYFYQEKWNEKYLFILIKYQICILRDSLKVIKKKA